MLLAGIPGQIQDRYREILTSYFAHGCRLKETAEALFVHKNTLQYQLDGIHRATGYNPRSFSDAVVLYLALALSEEGGEQQG